MAAVTGRYQPVKLLPETRAVGSLYTQEDTRYTQGAAATVTAYGKGKIAGVYVNVGENYLNNQAYLYRDFLTALVRELLPRPIVSVEGSHLVHTTVNQLGKKRIIYLINTAGPHANTNIYTYDEIPPRGPLTVRVRTAGKPTRITCEPAHQPVGFEYANGQAVVKLPRLAIHEMLVVE